MIRNILTQSTGNFSRRVLYIERWCGDDDGFIVGGNIYFSTSITTEQYQKDYDDTVIISENNKGIPVGAKIKIIRSYPLNNQDTGVYAMLVVEWELGNQIGQSSITDKALSEATGK